MLEAWKQTETARPLGAGNRLVMTDSNKTLGCWDTVIVSAKVHVVSHPQKDCVDIKTHHKFPKPTRLMATGPAYQPASGILPDWKTYRARPCISSAGHVGGADSPVSLFRRNVNSKPKPLGPSVPVNLKGIKHFQFNYHRTKSYQVSVW